jgi:hypothetical protein
MACGSWLSETTKGNVMSIRDVMKATAAAVFLSAPFAAGSQQLIVYPAKGQSEQQQKRDQSECQAWATKSTGIDPVALAQAPAPAPSGPAVGGGERAAGAARGAVGGLAIGAIAGDAGQGAAIGAVVGTMAGGRQARQNQSAKQQQAQQQKQQQMNTWNRAVGACLEGRGYTVK